MSFTGLKRSVTFIVILCLMTVSVQANVLLVHSENNSFNNNVGTNQKISNNTKPESKILDSPENISKAQEKVKSILAGAVSGGNSTGPLRTGYTVVENSSSPTKPLASQTSQENISHSQEMVKRILAGAVSGGNTGSSPGIGYSVVTSSAKSASSPSFPISQENISKTQETVKRILTEGTSNQNDRPLPGTKFSVLGNSSQPAISMNSSISQENKSWEQEIVKKYFSGGALQSETSNPLGKEYTVVKSNLIPHSERLPDSPENNLKKQKLIKELFKSGSEEIDPKSLQKEDYKIVISNESITASSIQTSAQTLSKTNNKQGSSNKNAKQATNINLPYNEVVSGAITNVDQIDRYSFSATVGDTIEVKLLGSWYNYPKLSLWKIDETSITSNAGPYQGIINYQIPDTGTYILTVEDYYHSSTGTYSLYLTKLNPPLSAIPIHYGEYITGYCNDTAELILYSLTAQSGDTIRIFRESSCTDMYLFSPSGVPIYITDPTTLSTSGNYTVAVTSTPGTPSGSYTFYIDSVNHPATVTSLMYGQTVNGSLDSAIDTRVYSFSGKVGDAIEARTLTSWYYYPRLSLWKTDGTQLTSSDWSFQQIQ